MASLDTLRRRVEQDSAERVKRAAAKMTADLKRGAPVDTGTTQRETGVEVTSATRNRITAVAEIRTDYAEVVVYATRPHVIKAKNAQALRFNWPKAGGVVYFKQVHHPGTPGNPWFFDIVNKWGEYLSAS